MRPEAVQAYGVPLLEALNNIQLPGLPPGSLFQPTIEPPAQGVPQGARRPGPTLGNPGRAVQAQPGAQGAPVFAGPTMRTPGLEPIRPVPMPQASVPAPTPAPMPPAAVPAPMPGPALQQPPSINPVPPISNGGPDNPFYAESAAAGAAGPRPQAPMPRQGGGGVRPPPRGSDGPVGTDALNMLSLAAARGEGPTTDPRLRQADQNIRGAMANPPQYREGGLVMPPGGAMMPPDPFEAMMQGGGEGPGHEMMEGGEEGEEDPYAPPGMERPYADAECGPNPFMPEDQNQGVTGDQVMQNFQALPPEAQQMAMTILGGDPMISSALLAILGPAIEPLLAQAMKASAAPIAQQNALPNMLGMGGQPPMMG